jgi:hypothetical protein
VSQSVGGDIVSGVINYKFQTGDMVAPLSIKVRAKIRELRYYGLATISLSP